VRARPAAREVVLDALADLPAADHAGAMRAVEQVGEPPAAARRATRELDGVVLTEHTDFAALVHDILRGGGGVGSRPGDDQPLAWIVRALAELSGSPCADRLTRGVAAALTAPEPAVRGQALVFFQSHPCVAGGDRVNELVAGDRRLFRDVADPIHPGTDLEWQLLDALAARVALGDKRAAELARREVVQPGKAVPIIARLVAADPDWVVAHAEDIVRSTPAAGATILIQLQHRDLDLVAIARRIAAWCQGDDRFELDVSRLIDDAAVRDQILAASNPDRG